MRRLAALERGILAAGILLLVLGVLMVLHLTEVPISHQGYRVSGTGLQHVSESGTQVYGVISILFGFGFVWMALARGKK